MGNIDTRSEIEHGSEFEFAVSLLEKNNEDCRQLLKSVAHDLKNPLGAIYSIAALMLADDNRSDEDKELLELITDSVNSLTRTVNHLLVSNINTSVLDLYKENQDIEEVLRHSVSLLQFKADEKLQLLVVDIKGKDVVCINRDCIWRVVNSLIVNAIKFSEIGSTINILVEKKEKTIIVSVKDKGIGIPQSLQQKIFTLTEGAHRIGTSGEPSHGLGLHICKEIIEAHKGSIWFESIENIGTTFYFSLPMA